MRWSLLLLLVALIGFAVGVGWWVTPAAGLTAGSVLLGAVALVVDMDRVKR